METRPFTDPKVGMFIRVGGEEGNVCKILSVQGDGYGYQVINGYYDVDVKDGKSVILETGHTFEGRLTEEIVSVTAEDVDRFYMSGEPGLNLLRRRHAVKVGIVEPSRRERMEEFIEKLGLTESFEAFLATADLPDIEIHTNEEVAF